MKQSKIAPNFYTEVVGVFKLKDKINRDSIKFVLSEQQKRSFVCLYIKKVKGQTNKIELIVILKKSNIVLAPKSKIILPEGVKVK